MIRMEVIGMLGKDPERKATRSGNEVVTFSVAVNEFGRRKQKEATWIYCTIFNDTLMERAVRFLKKGDRIYVGGHPDVSAYERNGAPVASINLAVEDMEMLGGNTVTAEEHQQTEEEAAGMTEGYTPVGGDDELPF